MRRSTRNIWLVIAAILVFFGGNAVAWWYYDAPYSVITHNISRLGRPNWNPTGHWFWLGGIVFSNVFLIAYYRSLALWKIGVKRFDYNVKVITILAYFSCFAIVALGIVNADHRTPHRIFGAIYFSTDILMMLLGILLIIRHPKTDNAMALLCILSVLTGAIYLISGGKASWAEWTTVASSFGVALWLAINSRRLDQ